MLLTSGQLSMGISSIVVFAFTSLLFLSGYVLQQQTVRSLQIAIHPPQPSPSPNPSKATASGEQQPLEVIDSAALAKAAHVQIVRRHRDVCNAVMLYADIARQNGQAQMVIIYPKAWDRQFAKNDVTDRRLATSIRLLRKAKARYNVILRPVEPMFHDTNDLDVAYPLAGLLSLAEYDRLLYLLPNGLVIHATGLETLFSVPMEASALSFQANPASACSAPATLMMPSKDAYREAIKTLPSQDSLASLTSLVPLPETVPYLLACSSALNSSMIDQHEDGDVEVSLISTAYVRFSDQGILGPEYDVPMSAISRVRPEKSDLRRVWSGLYERYHDLRMDICGLDLEPMPLEIHEKGHQTNLAEP